VNRFTNGRPKTVEVTDDLALCSTIIKLNSSLTYILQLTKKTFNTVVASKKLGHKRTHRVMY